MTEGETQTPEPEKLSLRELLVLLKPKSLWSMICALLVAFGFVFGAGVWVQQHILTEKKSSVQPRQAETLGSVTWYGYFADVDEKDQPVINKETLTLTFSKREDDLQQIVGKTSGEVIDEKGIIVPAEWQVVGFHASRHISMAYLETGLDLPTGIGSYFLQADREDLYKGFWLGFNADHEVVRGAYLLSKSKISLDVAKSRYGKLANGIEEVDVQ